MTALLPGVEGPAPEHLRHLWQPLSIGPTEVRNRVMYTAQGILYGEDHILGDRHVGFYRERAQGGLGLMITEQQAGHPIGKGSFHMGLTAWDKRAVAQFAKLADAVHEFGAKQFVQLFAPGVHDKGTMIYDEWHPLWGVSRVPSIVHREIPMVMEKEHIDDLVRRFGESALNVKAGGLDGVEIHAAHSYLLSQFLSPAYNKRTDAYGGSVANRARVHIEIAESIRRQVGGDITVGLRLSFNEFMGDAGITEEQSEETLEILAATGLFDYFSVSGGGYHSLHNTVAPMHWPEGFMIPFGRRAKQIVGDRAKIFIVGKIVNPRMADEIVAEGAADMVAMTRAHLADPFLVRKATEGREREITRCVGAQFCMGRNFEQREVGCMLNPVTGRERQWGEGTLRPAAEPKRVAVVGGGPAGIRAAAIASRRGHEVVLFEATAELGGHLNVHKRLPTRANWQLAIDDMAQLLESAGVEVRLDSRADRESLAAGGFEAVVCATGSEWQKEGYSPCRPEREAIPGSERENVFDIATALRTAFANPRGLGSRLLVVDETGGWYPFGLAEIVAAAGVEVEIVTPHLFAGEELVQRFDWYEVAPRLAELDVRLTPQHFIEYFDGAEAEIYYLFGPQRERRSVDGLVPSMYRAPREGLYHQLLDRFPEVHRVGDVVAPRKTEAVIYEGEQLGRSL